MRKEKPGQELGLEMICRKKLGVIYRPELNGTAIVARRVFRARGLNTIKRRLAVFARFAKKLKRL